MYRVHNLEKLVRNQWVVGCLKESFWTLTPLTQVTHRVWWWWYWWCLANSLSSVLSACSLRPSSTTSAMWVHQGELNCLYISTPMGLVWYLGGGAAGVGSAFCQHLIFGASERGLNKCTSSELPAKGLMVLSNVTPHWSAVTPNKSALIYLRIGVTEQALNISG